LPINSGISGPYIATTRSRVSNWPAPGGSRCSRPAQPVQPGLVGVATGHPQHHALIAAIDPVQDVLRAAGEALQDGSFALARAVVVVEPPAQIIGVRFGRAG
jgi:hypothetical protein